MSDSFIDNKGHIKKSINEILDRECVSVMEEWIDSDGISGTVIIYTYGYKYGYGTNCLRDSLRDNIKLKNKKLKMSIYLGKNNKILYRYNWITNEVVYNGLHK